MLHPSKSDKKGRGGKGKLAGEVKGKGKSATDLETKWQKEEEERKRKEEEERKRQEEEQRKLEEESRRKKEEEEKKVMICTEQIRPGSATGHYLTADFTF